jgi:hypothetical protein
LERREELTQQKQSGRKLSRSRQLPLASEIGLAIFTGSTAMMAEQQRC